MERLTKEDIVFIENYLINSEINFIDIRLEMVDHVASEIEEKMNSGDSRGFYNIFKDYMVKNKSILLKGNKKYYRSSDKKILKSILKNMISVKGLTFFFALLFSFFILNKFLEQQIFVQLLKYMPIVLFSFVAIWYRFFLLKKGKRFSSIERIGLYFMGIGQIINMFVQTKMGKNIESMQELNRFKIVVFITTFLVLILIQTSFQFKKHYETKYKGV